MHVIEKFVEGKYDDQNMCEDGIVVSKNFISIIDGVSSQSDFRYMNKKLGRIILEILQEAIPKIPPECDLEKTIKFLNSYIIEYYKKINIYDEIKYDHALQPAASLIIYSRYYNQIWLIGDCLALYGDNIILENGLEVDKLYTKLRTILCEYYLSTGYTKEQLLENDITKEFVKKLEKRQPYLRNQNLNSKYDYAVIDGFNEVNLNLTKCVDLPKTANEIVFTSDGYIKPFFSLAESENYLEYAKNIDPLRIKEFAYEKAFINGKNIFDDRAYIRFRI